MTLQLPLLARIEQQQAAAAKARGAEAQPQAPAARPHMTVSSVPAGPLPGAGSPWIQQQDLMAWLLAGGAKDPSLQLNKTELAAEWNTAAAERSSPAASYSDLIVPQAPGSPTTTLHGFSGDAAPPTAPSASDQAAAPSVHLAGGKRSREDFFGASVPR